MIQMPENGTRRELEGVTRIFYEGYWVRCYAPPADNLEEKKKLIMRLTRRAFHHTEEGIIAVEIPPSSKHHLLLLFVAITVTPGTAVVAAESDGSVLYLHVLHCDRRASVEEHVIELAELANRALPAPDDEEQIGS